MLRKYRLVIFPLAALVGIGLSSNPASATTVLSSSAFALSADLTLLGLVGVSAGPFAATGGSAIPSYANTNTVLSLDQTLSIGVLGVLAVNQHLGTGVMSTSASSPYPTTPTSTATATVDNLGLALTTKTLFGSPVNILTIGATTVGSTTSASAQNMLSVTSLSNIEGLTISGLALGAVTIDGSLFVNPAPNTVIFNAGGLKIVLNEQLTSSDTNLLSRTTNAIHIFFDRFAISTGILSGGITVAQSQADVLGPPIIDVGPIPEPAAWMQMIAGFGLAGAALRRQRRQATA